MRRLNREVTSVMLVSESQVELRDGFHRSVPALGGLGERAAAQRSQKRHGETTLVEADEEERVTDAHADSTLVCERIPCRSPLVAGHLPGGLENRIKGVLSTVRLQPALVAEEREH